MPRNIISSTAQVQGLDIAGNSPILCTNNFIESGGGTALTEGNVGVLDFSARALISAANPSTNFLPGDSASALAQVRAPTVDDRDAGIYVLLAEQPDAVTSIAVGEAGLFHLWGRNVRGVIRNNSGAAIDDGLVGTTLLGFPFYGQASGAFEELHAPATVTAGSKRIAVGGDPGVTIPAGINVANGAQGLVPLGIFDGFGLLLGMELI